jgi:hypothetical protein
MPKIPTGILRDAGRMTKDAITVTRNVISIPRNVSDISVSRKVKLCTDSAPASLNWLPVQFAEYEDVHMSVHSHFLKIFT